MWGNLPCRVLDVVAKVELVADVMLQMMTFSREVISGSSWEI